MKQKHRYEKIRPAIAGDNERIIWGKEIARDHYRGSCVDKTAVISCPFCDTDVRAYLWSLAGGGKRCPTCNAMHTYMGYSYIQPKPEGHNS